MVRPSPEMQKGMPLWHHPGEDHLKRQVNNCKKAKCMRKNHSTLTVGDGLNLTQCLNDPLHERHALCECNGCEEDRKRGCANPHACAAAAAARQKQILPKWIPKADHDGGPENGELEPEDSTGRFLPPETMNSLTQGLRAMTHRVDEPRERPNPPVQRCAQAAPAPIKTTVYIAGSVRAPAHKEAFAAIGIYFGTEDTRNKGRNIPSLSEQSTYVAEFYAALEAVQGVSKDSELTIISTQNYVRDAMNKKSSPDGSMRAG
ncbi:hypothetical protein C8R44DRAFT_652867 [Mycena epipterygia]|nr:hypothetical protein C8R44DRAFT_652867 [Mycena epipterygia]